MKKKNIILSTVALAVLLMTGVNAIAQVKRVQMHIAGYLCGN
jgi:hypothetical protein